MIISILFVLVGFGLLIKGAGLMVEGASALAKKYNVSDMIIGLTIVALGTSMPELMVNSVASWGRHSDIVFGNVIGSNIVNLFLILGIVGIIYPISVPRNSVTYDIPISIFAVVILYVLSNNIFSQHTNSLSRADGLILLIILMGFVYYIFRQMKTDSTKVEEVHVHNMSGLKMWLYIFIGIASLILGGKLVVDHSVKIATVLGVSEKIIGLTIVAIGTSLPELVTSIVTSLPELVTSIVAARKQKSDIAFGNIIGSNVLNIFLILSVSSLIHPLNYNTSFNTELYLLGFGTVLLFVAMFTGGRRKLDRWEAAIFLAIYFIYMFWLIADETNMF